MKIVCKASNIGSDVRCAVCGQGFLVDWSHGSAEERARQFASVLDVLRKHHVAMNAESAHPSCEFCLPEFEVVKREPQPIFAVASPIASATSILLYHRPQKLHIRETMQWT